MATPIGTAATVTAQARTTVFRTAVPRPGELRIGATSPPSAQTTWPRRTSGNPTRTTRAATRMGTATPVLAPAGAPPGVIAQPPKTCWYSPRIASLCCLMAAQSGETTGAPSGIVGPGTPGSVGYEA